MKKIFLVLILLASFGFAQDQAGLKSEIYNNPSKKELFSRARDVLKKSLEAKDFERAGEAYSYLQANVGEGAPLTVFEEYLIDMEMGKYADGIRKYANQRRLLLDSSYTLEKKNDRFTEKDALHKYLYDKFDPFTEAKADSMVKLVDASDVSDELKDLYAAMIYGELTIGFDVYTFHSKTFLYSNVRDTARADQFLERARTYVEKNPYTEHSGYLKNSTIPMVEKVVTRLREFLRPAQAQVLRRRYGNLRRSLDWHHDGRCYRLPPHGDGFELQHRRKPAVRENLFEHLLELRAHGVAGFPLLGR